MINNLEETLENRRFLRAKYLTSLVCTIIQEDGSQSSSEEKTVELSTTDISLGGFAAQCSHGIDIGTYLSLTLEIEGTHHVVKVQVVYCGKQGELYKIGTEFVNPKPVLIERIKRLAMKQQQV